MKYISWRIAWKLRLQFLLRYFKKKKKLSPSEVAGYLKRKESLKNAK